MSDGRIAKKICEGKTSGVGDRGTPCLTFENTVLMLLSERMSRKNHEEPRRGGKMKQKRYAEIYSSCPVLFRYPARDKI